VPECCVKREPGGRAEFFDYFERWRVFSSTCSCMSGAALINASWHDPVDF
jgi:hypothetical protein